MPFTDRESEIFICSYLAYSAEEFCAVISNQCSIEQASEIINKVHNRQPLSRENLRIMYLFNGICLPRPLHEKMVQRFPEKNFGNYLEINGCLYRTYVNWPVHLRN